MNIPAIQKEISKKKQFRACDSCRKSKKKCDGMSPCARCQENTIICTYSPRPLKQGKKTKCQLQQSSSIQVQSSAIADTVVSRQYIEMYLDKINPASLYGDFTLNDYDLPKSKAILLQYNAILATSTRAFAEGRICRNFETRAKQLAADLLNDFSFDTAVGYYLLSYHLWGEDEEIGCHYRDITLSMCKRMIRSQQKLGKPISHIHRLQIASSIINYVGESDFSLLGDTIDQVTRSPIGLHGPTFDVLLLGKFQSKLWEYLFKDPSDPNYDVDPFKDLSEEHFNELEMMASQFEAVLRNTFVLSDQQKLVVTVMHMSKAMIYYAAKRIPTALFYCKQAATILESNLHLAPFCSPFVATVCHLIILIAYLENECVLASRISGFQRKLADLMPSCREILEKDMSLLRLNESKPPKREKEFVIESPPSPLRSSQSPNTFEISSFMFQPASITNSPLPPQIPFLDNVDLAKLFQNSPTEDWQTNHDSFISDLFM